MANGRGSGRTKRDNDRDPGGFIAMPLSVLDCPGYAALSHTARSLLLEVARQCKGDDNGRLLLSRAHLAGRGWKSVDVIQRAKAELIAREFIFETVKGHFPNTASWYAVTWRKLGGIKGFDPGAERAFEQGAYRRGVPTLDVTKLRGSQGAKDVPKKNAALVPSHGPKSPPIGPSHGTVGAVLSPSHGPMRGVFVAPSVPSHGHPLEKPSAAAARAAALGLEVVADARECSTLKATHV